jgi:hypothetical protein
MADITDLLEGTTPRSVRPPDIGHLVRRGRRRRQRRRASLLLAPVVVASAGIVVGLMSAGGPGDRDSSATVIAESVTDPLAIAAVSDADVVVFLETGITGAQLVSLGDVLDDDPRIASFEYYDSEAFLAEVRRVFRDNAAMLERIEQSPALPASFRIVGTTPHDRDTTDALAADLRSQPGVVDTVIPG